MLLIKGIGIKAGDQSSDNKTLKTVEINKGRKSKGCC